MEGVYLIHQNTGNCIIFKKYGNLEFNEDLIAGFLTALKDFAGEVTGGQGIMKTLKMGQYSILLLNDGGILVAGALDRRDDESIAFKALQEMLKQFIKEYKDDIPGWKGNLSLFRPFEEKIDKYLKGGKIAQKEIYAPLLKKKLPKQLIDMGALTKEEFSFADYFNGADTVDAIAEKAGMPMEKVEIMVEKFKELGLVKMNKL